MAVAASREEADVGAGVVVARVAVVAVLLELLDAVAAAGPEALGRARPRIRVVGAPVALLAALGDAVAAALGLALVVAAVAGDGVAVVAGLIHQRVHEAVAADRQHAVVQAAGRALLALLAGGAGHEAVAAPCPEAGRHAHRVREVRGIRGVALLAHRGIDEAVAAGRELAVRRAHPAGGVALLAGIDGAVAADGEQAPRLAVEGRDGAVVHAVVALLAALDDAVAALLEMARRPAAVAGRGVAIVALLAGLLEPVAADDRDEGVGAEVAPQHVLERILAAGHEVLAVAEAALDAGVRPVPGPRAGAHADERPASAERAGHLVSGRRALVARLFGRADSGLVLADVLRVAAPSRSGTEADRHEGKGHDTEEEFIHSLHRSTTSSSRNHTRRQRCLRVFPNYRRESTKTPLLKDRFPHVRRKAPRFPTSRPELAH